MPLFEEPLSGHLGDEPILIHDIVTVSETSGNVVRLETYVIFNDRDGRLRRIPYDANLTVDWRWLPKDERWYDLVDINAMQERKAGDDDGAVDEPNPT